MSNLPALPQRTQDADSAAADFLSATTNSLLRINRSTLGGWILSASDELTASGLASALGAFNRAMEGGPTARIATALMRLTSATRKPAWLDEDGQEHYFDTVQEALHEYPIDVVEAACRAWRRSENGEWWPAEKELRRICDELFKPRRDLRFKAGELLRHLEGQEAAQERARQPSPFAGDAHRVFREAMRGRLAPHRFAAYFNPTHILFQGQRDILVRSKIAEIVLNEEGADIVAQYDLRIEHSQESFARIRDVQPEQSPEQDQWVGERMTRLSRAMANGDDIKALIKEGVL